MRHQSEFLLLSSSTPSITLFSQYGSSSRPIPLLGSVLIHGVVIGAVSFGILTAPGYVRVNTEHLMVRHLELRTPDKQRTARGETSDKAKAVAEALRATAAPPPAAMREAVHAAAGPQTLLQPDLPTHVMSSEEIPVPRMLIWVPRKDVVQNVVAPKPAPSTTADSKPSLDAPNSEIDLADVDIASVELPTQKLTLMPSTTSPVVVHAQSQVQLPPAEVTQQTAQPTPTAVLSVSDLQLKDGTATLPPINEALRSTAPGALNGSSGIMAGTHGNTNGGANGNGTDRGASGSSVSGPVGARNGMPTASAQGTNSGNSVGGQPSTTSISLPRDGIFNAVIVGESVQDRYPEMADVWSGRMAYTVYLHLGSRHNWILQYSLPRTDEAAMNGGMNRLEAPWPYYIVRPNLSVRNVDADALMVHGYVSLSGHFENLSMVFPEAFPQATFVLKSLDQWQLRPASRNGQATRVEVLLIIPEELD